MKGPQVFILGKARMESNKSINAYDLCQFDLRLDSLDFLVFQTSLWVKRPLESATADDRDSARSLSGTSCHGIVKYSLAT